MRKAGMKVHLLLEHVVLARLALLPKPFCLAKNHQITFLKLASKVYSNIWLIPPPLLRLITKVIV